MMTNEVWEACEGTAQMSLSKHSNLMQNKLSVFFETVTRVLFEKIFNFYFSSYKMHIDVVAESWDVENSLKN